MNELTIPWTPVKALLHLAAKDDIRKWCNGVWVDRRGPRLIVWATTGTILGVYRTGEPSTDGPDVFLPRHILDVCKSFIASATVKREDDGRMSISCMGTTHYWQDEAFVPIDWRRVMPAGHADGCERQVNTEYLAQFIKVHKALGEAKSLVGQVLVAHRTAPEKSADGLLVSLPDVPDFVGVIMPVNDKALHVANMRRVVPDWVTERGRVPAEETSGADLV